MSDTASENYDFDWIVIGSGFGGASPRSGWREGLPRRRPRDGQATGRGLRGTTLEPSPVLLEAEARPVRHPPDDRREGRLHRLGAGVGGGSLVYANTLLGPGPPSSGTRGGATRGLEGCSSRTTRRQAHARRRPDRRAGRPHAEGDRRGHGPRRHVPHRRGRRVLRGGRRDGARSVLRRRGPGAHRLHPLRRLHGRLPARREEHARGELPLVRGEARGRDPPGASGDRRPAARRGRRLRGLHRDQRAIRLLGPQAPLDPDRPRRDRGGRRPGHESAPPDLPRTGLAAEDLDRLGELVRTNSESINAVTAPSDERDFAKSVAISSSIYPDPDTHIEVVTYGTGADSMATSSHCSPGRARSSPARSSGSAR